MGLCLGVVVGKLYEAFGTVWEVGRFKRSTWRVEIFVFYFRFFKGRIIFIIV